MKVFIQSSRAQGRMNGAIFGVAGARQKSRRIEGTDLAYWKS
jgi:hypothetical protein